MIYSGLVNSVTRSYTRHHGSWKAEKLTAKRQTDTERHGFRVAWSRLKIKKISRVQHGTDTFHQHTVIEETEGDKKNDGTLRLNKINAMKGIQEKYNGFCKKNTFL